MSLQSLQSLVSRSSTNSDRLCTLPSELKLEILTNVTDLSSLVSLLLAAKTYRNLFRRYPEEVLLSVGRNEWAAGAISAIPLNLLLLLSDRFEGEVVCSREEYWAVENVPSVEGRIKRALRNLTTFPNLGRIIREKVVLTKRACYEFLKQHRTICHYSDRYAADIIEENGSGRDPTLAEMTRIQSSFYRLWIAAEFLPHRPECLPGEPQYKDFIFGLPSCWHIEGMAAVYKYIARKIHGNLQELAQSDYYRLVGDVLLWQEDTGKRMVETYGEDVHRDSDEYQHFNNRINPDSDWFYSGLTAFLVTRVRPPKLVDLFARSAVDRQIYLMEVLEKYKSSVFDHAFHDMLCNPEDAVQRRQYFLQAKGLNPLELSDGSSMEFWRERDYTWERLEEVIREAGYKSWSKASAEYAEIVTSEVFFWDQERLEEWGRLRTLDNGKVVYVPVGSAGNDIELNLMAELLAKHMFVDEPENGRLGVLEEEDYGSVYSQ